MEFYNIDQCLKVMRFTGNHPQEIGSRLQLLIFIIEICLTLSMCYLLALNAYLKENISLLGIVDCANQVLFCLHGATFQICLFIVRSPLNRMITLMKTKFWTIDDVEVEEDRREYLEQLKHLKFKFNFFHRIILVDIVLFLFGESIKTGTLDADIFPIKVYYPKFIPFILMISLITVLIVLNASCPVMTGILMFTSVGLAERQFIILGRKFERAFDGVTPSKNDIVAKDRLRECNEHLTDLLEFRNVANETFSMLMFLYMGLIIFSLCLNMYISSNAETLQDSIRAVVYASGLLCEVFYCYCLPAEKFVIASEQSAGSLYLSQWAENTSLRKTIVLLIGKAHQRIYITAAGLTDINHLFGMFAIKTVISYWTFLRTVGTSGCE